MKFLAVSSDFGTKMVFRNIWINKNSIDTNKRKFINLIFVIPIFQKIKSSF